jgi:hypothetical protein
MSVKALLKYTLPPRWRRGIRELLLPLWVSHLSGPSTIRLSRHDAVVTCVVKNGEFHIKSFIDHYSRLGFRHIFFLDNGSSDQTVSIARAHSNVSICQSTLPIDTYQGLLKKYLAVKSAQGGWCLDADIDELFDYPNSDAMPLPAFLEYLNARGFTAVITQLLDMFSEHPLSHLTALGGDDLRTTYKYYDVSNLARIKYQEAPLVASYGSRNQVSNESTALYYGGIRKTLYGNNCLLTKHSLFMPGERLDLFPHVHFVDRARLADVSCVMLHYKLTCNALGATLQNKEGFVGNSQTYGRFIDFLLNNPEHQIRQHTAVEFKGAEELVKSSFLFASRGYYEHVRARTTQRIEG